MAIGMTYEEYWHGDPLMVRAYYKADKIRQRRINEEAWLHGAYVLNALDATLGNMFRKEGTKPTEYPAKPYELGPVKEETNTISVEEQEELFAKAYMTNMVLAGKNWKK